MYGWALSQCLPYDESKIDKDMEIGDRINTPEDSDMGKFLECELIYPDSIGQKTKIFLFLREKKVSTQDKFCFYLNEI